MKRFFNRSVQQIPTSGLTAIWDKASKLEAAGRDIVHFEIGRPDWDTPTPIKEAAKRALDAGHVHYTMTRGIPELRQAIAADLKERNKVDLDWETEICVTIGAVEGINSLIMTVLEAGDELLVPDPMYLFYLEWGLFFDAKTKSLPVRQENGFQITPELLEEHITDKTKIFIVNSPNNPTGAGYDRSSLEAIAAAAIKHDLLIICDEVYDRLTYAPFEHISIASLPGMKERTIIVNSFSKPFAMDGWRIGYMAGPAELLAEIDKAHIRAATCATAFCQWGAVEAIRQGETVVGPVREKLTKRKELIMDMINSEPGFTAPEPKGAFYAWLDYGPKKADTWEVTMRLMEEAGVAVTPGVAFGPAGENHIRISFANTRANIEKGMKRIFATLNKVD